MIFTGRAPTKHKAALTQALEKSGFFTELNILTGCRGQSSANGL